MKISIPVWRSVREECVVELDIPKELEDKHPEEIAIALATQAIEESMTNSEFYDGWTYDGEEFGIFAGLADFEDDDE